MRFLRLLSVISLGALFFANPSDSQQKFSQRKYDLQPAPDFVFQDKQFHAPCADRPSTVPMRPGTAFLTVTPQAPYLRTRLEHFSFPRADIPALTVTADVGAVLKIAGEDRDDWSLRLCARGEGDSAEQALARMQQVSLTHVGGTVSLGGSSSNSMPEGRADLTIQAPQDAPMTVHSSFAAVEVLDMSGPVRIAAPRGRATILNSTGRVDVTAFVVDFAGARGTIILNAGAEIDLKLTAARFQGSLSASAGHAVRVLVPQDFQTPFQAIVSRRDDFVCRADFCSAVKSEKKNGLYVFTFLGDGATPPEQMSLRSEQATVVIDIADRACTFDCSPYSLRP